MRKIARTERTAQKRRDSWPQTWSYYQVNRYGLKIIQQLTFGKIDSEKELKDYLGKQLNPILGFRDGEFFFDEQGLRHALQAIKADLSQFGMEVQEYVSTEVTDISYNPEYGDRGNVLLRFYYKRKDVRTQTCFITYRNMNMEIRRWIIKGSCFGLYDVKPILQIPCKRWVLTEAEFQWLDVANLLKDLALEHELCQEEFIYHSKQLRINSMEVSVMDEEHIPFVTIDEATIENLIKECAAKQLDKEQTFKVIVQPWMDSIRDYLLKMTNKYKNQFFVCDLPIKPTGGLVEVYGRRALVALSSKPPQESYIKLCKEKQVEGDFSVSDPVCLESPPRQKTHAWFKVKEAELEIDETLFRTAPQKDKLILFPNSKDHRFQIEINGQIGIHALVSFLKLMPELCQQMNDLQKKIDCFLNF